MNYPAAIPVILLAACLGCSNQSHERVVSLPEQIVVSKPAFATQRFIPTNSADVAFDTKTGTLCRTWNWSDPSGTAYRSGLGAQTSTCDHLYELDEQDEIRKVVALERGNPAR